MKVFFQMVKVYMPWRRNSIAVAIQHSRCSFNAEIVMPHVDTEVKQVSGHVDVNITPSPQTPPQGSTHLRNVWQ